MSSATTPRLIFRHTRFVGRQTCRRHASTQEAASNGVSKAKDTASNVQSKASQGLSRVTSSAGPAISGATQGISRTLGRVGGRTGRLISFVECMYTFQRASSNFLDQQFAKQSTQIPDHNRVEQDTLESYNFSTGFQSWTNIVSHSHDPTNFILLKSWLRAFKNRFQRTKDEPTVRRPSLCPMTRMDDGRRLT